MHGLVADPYLNVASLNIRRINKACLKPPVNAFKTLYFECDISSKDSF
jgi:hypothetical protein